VQEREGHRARKLSNPEPAIGLGSIFVPRKPLTAMFNMLPVVLPHMVAGFGKSWHHAFDCFHSFP
jgi:hypothetical protein